jgi:hypothetical protein
MALRARLITQHTQVQIAFKNSFKLQRPVSRGALRISDLVGGRSGSIRGVERVTYLRAGRQVAHQDEPRRLHQADGRRRVRRTENPIQHLWRNGPENKTAPHIAPLGNRPIDRRTFLLGKAAGAHPATTISEKSAMPPKQPTA